MGLLWPDFAPPLLEFVLVDLRTSARLVHTISSTYRRSVLVQKLPLCSTVWRSVTTSTSTVVLLE